MILNGDMLVLLISMLITGAFAGLTAGLFGVGGGFVVVPVLLLVFNFIDVPMDVAVHLAIGTSLATILTTSIRATHAHAKHDAVDFHVVKSWAPWLVLGVLVGLVIANDARSTLLIGIFGGGVLLLSAHFLFPNWLSQKRISNQMPHGTRKAVIASLLGGISALLGIGGGTVAVLPMTLSGRPIHQAIGTASSFGALIAVPGSLGFVIIGWNSPNLPFGSLGYVNLFGWLVISVVSVSTVPLGTMLAHRLAASTLKRAFGIYLLIVGGFMLNKSFIESMQTTSTSTTITSAELTG